MQRCLLSRSRFARTKRPKELRMWRGSVQIWQEEIASAWEIIALDIAKTSQQRLQGLNMYGELQRRDRPKANNNLARALTKPARGSVCFCTSGAPEGWPRVEICRKNLLGRL